MKPEEILSQFTIDQLKEELQTRGASTRVQFSSVLRAQSKILGGRSELAQFSSKTIAATLGARQKSIYEVDDRKDLYDLPAQHVAQTAARGVVSLFRASRVVDNGNNTSTLQVGKFGQLNSLCEEERFFHQPAGAFCTGFLVAPDVIATAGHCVDENNATTIRFVFGFRMIDANLSQIVIPNEDIYAGAKVLGRRLVQDGTDWCLVRLDRPVKNGTILSLRRQNKIADKQSVYVIGHPCGLPVKYADGAFVRENNQGTFFTANLDTYGGNSGSPVFNADTHEVEGILVRGATDFVPVGMCMMSAVCPTSGCNGEDCTRTTEFAPLVP
ncbi:MAG: serine protease [Verrucomicrobia bacterium]|nr:serine protease [Verrucomicrobiota bacterium]